ncbi:MAG TPA: response regulator [Candidatus Omnitrophota bacterium]|nr:response regulator [Candidatus Omnitrophota bacterium]
MEEKKKILIIDDEKGFTSMLQLNLESIGEYEVRVENRAEKALEIALQFQPDIILLDVIMPNVEGPDVANIIHTNEGLKDIPIIFLTATVTKDEVDAQNGKIGGHTFVAKPSSLSDLTTSIKRNLLPAF